MRTVPLFVNGEGMRGGSVHHNIAGYPYLGPAHSLPQYRFYSIGDRFPAMSPTAHNGVAVPGEVYDVPLSVIRDDFMAEEPPELELGVVALQGEHPDALAVFLRHESTSRVLAVDISDAGGWRAYLQGMSSFQRRNSQ